MGTATPALDVCGPSSSGLVDAKTHTHTHVNGKHTFWTPWAGPPAAAPLPPAPAPLALQPPPMGNMSLAPVKGVGNRAIG